MASTPFNDIPKMAFINRMIWPCLGVFIFLFFCVGVVANSSEFQQPRGPAAVVPFWEASFKHYSAFFSHLGSIPDVCWTGNAVNEFQASQCSQFWGDFGRIGGLAAVPFIILGIILYMALEGLGALYKRVHKRILSGKANFTGTVTNPPEAAEDIFSWYYCFKPIMVQLANKQQLKVYVPLESASPRPGETLVAFDMGKTFGEKRNVGMVYAPHVAVVRGE